MAYLIQKDYQVNIQDVNIQQIISNDETIRDRAQLSGEAEAKSYLKQKYDISREFQDLFPFSISKTYYAFNRFYLYAEQYQQTLTYNIGDLATNDNNVYICNTNSTTGVFNQANWDALGVIYTIFSAPPPFPEFDYELFYKVGDKVFWKNKVYTCQKQTPVIDHDLAIQYREIQNIPYPNVPPDDSISGAEYWGVGVPYSIIGQLPYTMAYKQEDNRDAQIVLYLCDIVLYHLHSRIAPRNIPELRVKRYDDAIDWLKMCAEGNVTPNLPLIKPKQGNRIRYGGNVKQINSY